ncbi:MAG: hypothetical protein U0175_34560 [Caldilineaceae bacterium]
MKYNDPTGHIVTGDCMCGGNGDPFAEAESQLAGGSSGSTSSGGGGGSGSGGAGVATTILTGAAEAACENDGDCTNEVSTVSDTISKGLDTAQQIVETNGGSLQIIGEASSYSTSELRAAQYVADLGNEVILRPAENILNQRTSDLLVNGMSYDVYTPITTNANRIISAIASKGSQAQGIVLDLTQTTVKLKDLGNILARVQGAGAKGITDIIVIGGD